MPLPYGDLEFISAASRPSVLPFLKSPTIALAAILLPVLLYSSSRRLSGEYSISKPDYLTTLKD